MDLYGIAAASVSMNAMKLSQSVSLAMIGKTMDLGKEAAARMLEMVDGAPAAAPPPRRLDVSV